MSFFGVGGNPFSSPVGQKIEQATSENLVSEDWTLNIEICDMINHMEDGARDAMKAIRRRFNSQPKNYVVVMYTLTVLETCVKNCGKKMHMLVCSKDFVQELVKLIGPKNEPPTVVQEKVLSLIQSWAETFRHQPELSGVSQVYADLKHKGVEFPPVDLEPPIFTPERTVGNNPLSISPVHRQGSQAAPGSVGMNAQQMTKLRTELEMVESNGKVLSEMLSQQIPGKEQAEDLTLLKDLYDTCRVMQERVVDLVGRIPDDLLTADLLRINDDLNNLFVRYDRYTSKIKTHTASETQVRASATIPQQTDTPLIDFEETASANLPQPTLLPQMADLNLHKKNEDVDFDAFAQSRKTVDPSSTTDNIEGDVTNKELNRDEFDEMEKWLSQQQPNGNTSATQRSEDTVSSSDFDRFLAERAAAADTLPSLPPPGLPPRTRTLAKEDNGQLS